METSLGVLQFPLQARSLEGSFVGSFEEAKEMMDVLRQEPQVFGLLTISHNPKSPAVLADPAALAVLPHCPRPMSRPWDTSAGTPK